MQNIYTEMQLDILKEIGNIGIGNAATALSQMLDRLIDMEVPRVNIVPFEKMLERVGNADDIVVSIMLKVYGEAPGNLLFIMDEKDADKIFNSLMDGLYTDDEHEEVFISAFQEIGNILGNTYINAISQFIEMGMVCSIPSVARDMLMAIVSSTIINSGQVDEYVIEIDSVLLENNKKSESSISFFFIPEPHTMEKILEKIKLD